MLQVLLSSASSSRSKERLLCVEYLVLKRIEKQKPTVISVGF